MIRLGCSNRLETLADALAENAGAGRSSIFDPVQLIVPNGLVEGYAKQALARRLGIAAHVEARHLRGFLRDVATASAPDVPLAGRDQIEGALLALFHDPGWLRAPELGAVRDYLGQVDGAGSGLALTEGLDRKKVQLAAEVASLFDEYGFTRPEMLAAWRADHAYPDVDQALERWQRALWLALAGPRGVFTAQGALTLPDFYAVTPAARLRAPPAVHLFGISYVARLYGAIFETLGQATDLYVYALAPTSPGDDRADAGDEAPPFSAWGRPGRDNLRLLGALPGCSFDARFAEPPPKTRLAALQRQLLDAPSDEARRPRGRTRAGDDSLTIAPAADPRRELETIAAEIWRAIRADPTLTFADVAVVVPPSAADAYLPLAQAVFDEASRLPHTVVDLPRAAERRVVEAVTALLELPLGPLGRPELLRVAMHPAVARRFPEVDAEDWVGLCEALEIVRGADRADQPADYLQRDRTSWDQGLRRLALGAFLTGRRGGEERAFALDGAPDGRQVLAADLPAALEPAARALGILARELIAFARAVGEAPAPFEAHAALLRRTLAETVRPDSADEEAALGDVFAVLERIAGFVPPDLKMSFRVTAELVKVRLGAAARHHRAPEGVTVASFVPMRALPFRLLFLAGLDEGVFPAAEGLRALDLRAGARQPGDVTPRERDEHMFLEMLMAARQRLWLSYVARDAVTGEARGPSSVVRALAEWLEPPRAEASPSPAAEPAPVVPAAAAPSSIVREQPPLARHQDDAVCAVMPAADRERRAAALGASLRRVGGTRQLPPLGELRTTLSPAAWGTVAGALDWIAPPSAVAGRRARRGLTLADLRRFLECPLQASARVLLPVGDDGDAAADAEAALREHEPLDEIRLRTVPFLREVIVEVLGGPARDDDAALIAAYDRAAAARALDGTLPDGVFGRAARERHLGQLLGWREGVRRAGGDVGALAPIWLGAGPEHRRDLDRRPPLTVTPPDGPAVPISGRTDLLAWTGPERAPVIVSFSGSDGRDALERDLLGPFFTHLALAVLDDVERPTRALIVRPTEGADERTFAAVAPAAARAYLAELAAALVQDVHAYFLPCEAVFTRRRRLAKGEAMGVREAVLLLRDDNWTRFFSDRGPIPDPRTYPVPDEETAAALVQRRFGPYFELLIAPEGGPRRRRK